MKFYPDPNKPKGSRGYTEEEILKGHHFLLADWIRLVCNSVVYCYALFTIMYFLEKFFG